MRKAFQEKEAESKLTKIQRGRQVRDIRVQIIKQAIWDRIPYNKHICDECGFHIRGLGHQAGAHHNGRVAPCHRGR